MDFLYLALLAVGLVAFALQRRRLRQVQEEMARDAAAHGRAMAEVQVELVANREALLVLTGETEVTPTMEQLASALGRRLEKALARLSFEAAEVRAQVGLYIRPRLPAVVATAGTAARYQAAVGVVRF